MATLQELMAEVLGDDQKGHTKQASATKPSTTEVDEVLANLGLQGSVAVKTASDNGADRKNGGSMGSLAQIYEEVMGGTAPASQETATTTEKVATDATTTETADAGDSTSQFGELVGEYFNSMVEPFFNKIAFDLEGAAGKGEQPLAHADTASSLGASLGKQKDPHLSVNHSASGGADLKVTTKGNSPYSLKEKALAKEILRRSSAAPVGNIGE